MNWNPTSLKPLPSGERPKSIVLLSGGLDSTVVLAQMREVTEVLMALTVNYGQRAYGREYKASKAIAHHYEIEHQIIALPWLSDCLPQRMNFQAIPQGTPSEARWTNSNGKPMSPAEQAQSVWVPNRNGLFLNIAAALAEGHGAHYIAFGANAQEAENFPDNSKAFTQRTNAALALSTQLPVQVVTPLEDLNKAETVTLGRKLNAPLQMVWSCYEAGPEPCHVCPSCKLLDAALAQPA